MEDQQKKLKVGWFSFTCSEDSTIIFTELLNDHYKQWINVIDFVHFKTIQSKNEWREMDVAFVEGAISSKTQEEKVKKIRSLSKKLVAIGACACIGAPSTQRNSFDEATKKEIEFLLARFKYLDKVRKLSEVVTVDHLVQGCPMNEQVFLKLMNELLKEFGIA